MVMVLWWCMDALLPEELVIIEGTMNSALYHKIIKEKCLVIRPWAEAEA